MQEPDFKINCSPSLPLPALPQSARNTPTEESASCLSPQVSYAQYPKPPKKELNHTSTELEQALEFQKIQQEQTESLCSAAWDGEVSFVQRMLSISTIPDLVNRANQRDQTPLYCACRRGHVNVVLYLLQIPGINLSPQVKPHGNTPLHEAAFFNHSEVVALLIAAGAPLTIKNNMRIDPRGSTEGPDVIELFEAYNLEGINGLITRYPNIALIYDSKRLNNSYKDQDGSLFLLLYVFFPGSQTTWFVIDHKSKLIDTLQQACSIRKIDLKHHAFTDSNGKVLDKNMSCVDVPHQTITIVPNSQISSPVSGSRVLVVEELCSAILKKDSELFMQNLALQTYKTVNDTNGRGQTPLYCAAKEGDIEMVIHLLNFEGILIDKPDSLFGSTPLHVAAFRGHAHVVALLLFAGASYKIKNKLQHTAFSESGPNSTILFTLLENHGPEALQKQHPICSRLKKESMLIRNLSPLLPLTVSVPMVPLSYKTSVPSKATVKMMKEIVLLKLNLLRTKIHSPDLYFFMDGDHILQDDQIVELTIEPNSTVQFLRSFYVEIAYQGHSQIIRENETVKNVLDNLLAVFPQKNETVSLIFRRATCKDFEVMSLDKFFISYHLASTDALLLSLTHAKPIPLAIEFSPFDYLEHQLKIGLTRKGNFSFLSKSGWRTNHFELKNNQLTCQDDTEGYLCLNFTHTTKIKDVTKLHSKGSYYMLIENIDGEMLIKTQIKIDFDDWLFTISELIRIYRFMSIGQLPLEDLDHEPLVHELKGKLYPKLTLFWQVKENSLSLSKWKKTGSYYIKKLNPLSVEFFSFLKFLKTKLHGKGLHITDVSAVYTPHLVASFNCQRKNLNLRHRSLQHSAEAWRDGDDVEQKNSVMESYKKRVSMCSWNTGKELPILPVVHGTDQKTADLILESGFTTVSSLDLGYYGQGMYFSSNTKYTLPYFAVKPNPVIMVCFLIPGNVYPVTEDHTSDKSLTGSGLQKGYQCHYAVTNEKGAIAKQVSDCDEFVIFQEAQILPAYMIEIDKAKTLESLKMIVSAHPAEAPPEETMISTSAFKLPENETPLVQESTTSSSSLSPVLTPTPGSPLGPHIIPRSPILLRSLSTLDSLTNSQQQPTGSIESISETFKMKKKRANTTNPPTIPGLPMKRIQIDPVPVIPHQQTSDVPTQQTSPLISPVIKIEVSESESEKNRQPRSPVPGDRVCRIAVSPGSPTKSPPQSPPRSPPRSPSPTQLQPRTLLLRSFSSPTADQSPGPSYNPVGLKFPRDPLQLPTPPPQQQPSEFQLPRSLTLSAPSARARGGLPITLPSNITQNPNFVLPRPTLAPVSLQPFDLKTIPITVPTNSQRIMSPPNPLNPLPNST